MKRTEHTCQAVSDVVYLRCDALARTLVKPRGRSGGPYWLCSEHASYYLHNHGGEDVTDVTDTQDDDA